MGADGSGPHRIGPGASPAWSPEGSLIAFERWKSQARFDLDVMNADGTGVRTIVAAVRQTSVGLMSPTWSPDGRSLAFSSTRGLEVVAIGGGERRVIAARRDCVEASPAWSPDGRSIAFIEECSEAEFEAQDGIVLIAPDGAGWHRIVGPAGFVAFPPNRVSWSPDGQYLAFATEDESGGRMYLVRSDGSGLVQFGPGMEPTWSSDGARIAFVQQVGVNHDGLAIETIGVDGTGRRRLTPSGQVASQPDWQR
jgi:Tol biopolymer transport system component